MKQIKKKSVRNTERRKKKRKVDEELQTKVTETGKKKKKKDNLRLFLDLVSSAYSFFLVELKFLTRYKQKK